VTFSSVQGEWHKATGRRRILLIWIIMTLIGLYCPFMMIFLVQSTSPYTEYYMILGVVVVIAVILQATMLHRDDVASLRFDDGGLALRLLSGRMVEAKWRDVKQCTISSADTGPLWIRIDGFSPGMYTWASLRGFPGLIGRFPQEINRAVRRKFADTRYPDDEKE
jgi:hypothetical protein